MDSNTVTTAGKPTLHLLCGKIASGKQDFCSASDKYRAQANWVNYANKRKVMKCANDSHHRFAQSL